MEIQRVILIEQTGQRREEPQDGSFVLEPMCGKENTVIKAESEEWGSGCSHSCEDFALDLLLKNLGRVG